MSNKIKPGDLFCWEYVNGEIVKNDMIYSGITHSFIPCMGLCLCAGNAFNSYLKCNIICWISQYGLFYFETWGYTGVPLIKAREAWRAVQLRKL